MSNRVVMFVNGRASLYLSDVKFHADGSIKSGDVVNGGWRFERHNGECLAKDADRRIRNRWADPGYTAVPLKPEWRGDYNAVLAAAQSDYYKEH